MNNLSLGPTAELARSLEASAFAKGVCMVLCDTKSNPDKAVEYVGRISARGVGGAVLQPVYTDKFCDDNQRICQELKKHNIPFLLIDSHPEGLDCNYVGTDMERGARELIKAVLDLGHERVALIHASAATSPAPCVRAWRKVMAARNIEPDANLIKWIPWFSDTFQVLSRSETAALTATAVEGLLALPSPPTAILVYNDMMAVDCFRTLHRLGVRVPEDISVAGFDGSRLSKNLVPALTTVRQPLEGIAEKVMDAISRLADGTLNDPFHVDVRPELLWRETTTPPRRTEL